MSHSQTDEMANSMPTPTYGQNSPVTNLARNLSELSTKRTTPKRRLSLNSVDTPPSNENNSSTESVFSCASSTESGVFLDDSPSLLDSPTMENYARYKPNIPVEAFTKRKTIAFRRINSQPFPALRLDCDSPTDFLNSMETEDGCHSAPVPSNFSSCVASALPPAFSSASCPASSSVARLNFFTEEGSYSQDSGVGLDKDPGFKIPAPRLQRRKSRLGEISEETCSPLKYSPVKSPQKRRIAFSLGAFKNSDSNSPTDGDSPIRLKRSSLENSEDDNDDGFLDLDSEVEEINKGIPDFMASLLSDQILSKASNTGSNKDEAENETVYASSANTPVGRRILPAKRFLRRSQSVDIQSRQFKRIEPPETLAAQSKRWKSEKSHDDSYTSEFDRPPVHRLHRCHSETEAMIMSAVHRMTEEPDLIADSSKPYVLPMIRGKHQDLKSISSSTLSDLLSGAFEDQVEEFHVIDCRYPYEFDGGHIQNALNIYTRDGVMEQYLKNPRKTQDPDKRFIIIFHCEFSSERGPSLYRFLRAEDRKSNKECYPCLYYPEMYLLEGGYKAFFENHKSLCEPQLYKQMLHKDHSDDLRQFRAKSKSWAGAEKTSGRTGLRSLKF